MRPRRARWSAAPARRRGGRRAPRASRRAGGGGARGGGTRNPLWRKGGTVFGPQPRSYDYQLPKKVEKGALRQALAASCRGGDVIVVEAFAAEAIKTKVVAGLLKGLGVTGKALLVAVKPEEKFA